MFCVSYAVSPAKIKTPKIEIANIIAGDPKKMFIIEATRIPITPIIKNEPQPDISFLVV